jgi:hypothetical protein
MRMLTPSELILKLHEIESERTDAIGRLTAGEWSLWPSFRIAILHDLNPPIATEAGLAPLSAPRPFREFRLIARSLAELIPLAFRSNRGKCMIRTLTYSRRERYHEKWYCVFFDQLVKDLGPGRFLVSEGRGLPEQDYKHEIPNPVAFHDDGIAFLARCFRPWVKRRYRRMVETNRKIAAEIFPDAAVKIVPITISFWAHYLAWRLVYRIIRPGSILMTVATSARAEEIAAARSLGISTIEYQHGDIGPIDHSYTYSSALLKLKTLLPLPEEMFVFSEYQRKKMVSGGFWKDSDLLIGGMPQIDLYEKNYSRGARNNRSITTILVVSSVFSGMAESLRKFIWNYLNKNSDAHFKFSVRAHPSENTAAWSELISEFPNHVSLSDETFYSALESADLALGIYSTGLQEAVYFGVPVYILQQDVWEMSKDLIDVGAARTISANFVDSFEKFEVPASARYRYAAKMNLDLIEKTLFPQGRA